MKQPTAHLSFYIASTIVLLASIGLEWYAHACGLMLTSDSLQYLSAAKSFIDSGKFLGDDGEYYSYWSPLFPIILSFFDEPLQALFWINIVCKILLTISLAAITNRFINDVVLKIVVMTASLISVHVLMISVFVWSELIFMTLIFWHSYFALRLNEKRSFFYWLLVTGFLACLQRNAGLFWISGISLWMLLDNSISIKSRIIKSIIYFLICTSGLWVWNVYNTFFLPADFSFYRHAFFVDFVPNLTITLSSIGKMFLPMNGMLGIAIGTLFFSVVFYCLKSQIRVNRSIQFLIIVLMVYIINYTFMPGKLDYSQLDRYYSIIVSIIYLLIFILIDEQMKDRLRKKRIFIYILILIWLCYPMYRSAKNVQAWHKGSCASS